MSSINHKLRTAIIPCVKNNSIFFAKYLANVGGKDNDGSEDTGQDPSKICPICNRACDCNPCATPLYDCRKFGHNLPGNTRTQSFDVLPNFPTDIFRCTSGEPLGPQSQASKYGCYLNPEYFAYHHMTYYDMHIAMRSYRKPSPKTGRKG